MEEVSQVGFRYVVSSSEPVNQKKIKLIQGIGTYITKQKTVENLKG